MTRTEKKKINWIGIGMILLFIWIMLGLFSKQIDKVIPGFDQFMNKSFGIVITSLIAIGAFVAGPLIGGVIGAILVGGAVVLAVYSVYKIYQFFKPNSQDTLNDSSLFEQLRAY